MGLSGKTVFHTLLIFERSWSEGALNLYTINKKGKKKRGKKGQGRKSRHRRSTQQSYRDENKTIGQGRGELI